MMDIAILAKTPDALNVCWTAARTCKSQHTPQELMEHAKATDADEKIRLMKALLKARHDSIFEHVSFSFAVSGVSRALLAQFTRHRIGWSYSVQSQRFVKMIDARFVMPPGMHKIDLKDPLWIGDSAGYIIEDFVEAGVRVYDRLLSVGVKPEDARMVLPMGTACNLTATCNLRAFMDFYRKRVLAKGAQWEIRSMTERMAELITETEPWTAELFEELIE